MATYPSNVVANAFLYKARQSGAQISHMKLQKLVFFAHAWSLALQGSSVVLERPEAWTYGPVFDSLYHELKSYGSRPIDNYLVQMNPRSGQREPLMPDLGDTGFWSILNQVWEKYSPLTAIQLSAITHEPGGPWEEARKSQSGWLDSGRVRDHYRAQLPNAS